jgi:multidrug resistance efflux pump
LETEDIILNERDEIQAMLGKNPGCWVMYSIPMFVGLTLLLLGLSWFVQYPDVVAVPVTLTSEHPPVRILSRSAGKLSALRVQEGDLVQAGQVLAELESGATGTSVASLKVYLQQLEAAGTPEGMLALSMPPGLNLGMLQNTFSALLHAQKSLQIELQQDIIFIQISALENEKKETQTLIESLQRQADILKQDFALAENNLNRQRQLADQNLISVQEFEKTNSTYLREKQQLENFTSNISSQRVKIRQLETQQTHLSHGRRQEVLMQWAAIRQIALNLLGEINQWELLYLIKAPIAGRVVLSVSLTEQQFIQSEQELFSILSSDETGRVMALATLPQAGAGKVEPGQQVKIRLDGFPYQEFGVIEGIVHSIAPVATDNNYLVRINLPAGMQSSMHQTIPYKPEARGVGNIITKKRTLLERVFQQLWSLRE